MLNNSTKTGGDQRLIAACFCCEVSYGKAAFVLSC